MNEFNKKIKNEKGCGIVVGEVEYSTSLRLERFLGVTDDWFNCMTFEFDSKEQIQELINNLVVIKERWS